MLTNLGQKGTIEFICNICDYKTSHKSKYERHILTAKHKMLTNVDNFGQKSHENLFICECGKSYKHRQSLSVHKKKCSFIEYDNYVNCNSENIKKEELKNIVIKIMRENNELNQSLLKENEDLKNRLIEQNKQIVKQNDHISELIPKVGNNNNNLKQKFNINLFLNEKCKDAISMDEFIDKIEISMKNLLITKDKGKIAGINNIIMENMNKLGVYERPLHCTDIKKETIYVKNNEWEKDINKKCINKALKKLETKQLKNIQLWIDKHPNYMNNEKQQEEFAKLISECGKTLNEGKENIIKHVCNEVFINKD